MKYSDSILIARPVETVFDLLADVKRATEWDKSVIGVEIIHKGPWSERAKSIWHLKAGKETLEVIETVTAYSTPNVIASTFEITRFLPPTPQQIKDRGLPDINHEFELGEQFKFQYGNGPVSGNLRLECTVSGNDETILQIDFEYIVGGYTATAARVARLFRHKPLKKPLKNIKKAAESEPKTQNG